MDVASLDGKSGCGKATGFTGQLNHHRKSHTLSAILSCNHDTQIAQTAGFAMVGDFESLCF
jgi:hypothetical protein